MVEIDDVLISNDVFKKKFVCDLAACKGACCVEGEDGAPLTEEEASELEDHLDEIRPFMRAEGIEAVQKSGVFYMDRDNEPVTSLVNGKECAFVVFEEDGTAKCAIENAHRDGAIGINKPLSCHLYPIRISKLSVGEAMNYHKWPICAPACDCGEKLDVKVYKFLRAPLIRKYGEEFYAKMEAADEYMDQPKG